MATKQTKNSKYKSDALAYLHGMMADLHEASGIDKKTMRRFDEGCLTPAKMKNIPLSRGER